MNSLQKFVKTADEIAKMRVAGQLAADVLLMIEPYVQPGVSTEELDKICHDYIVNQQQAIPACLGYRGYPKSICTSKNHVVCHGIPNETTLKKGDILNIDVTVIKDGYHGDTSKMYIVGGETSIRAQRLVDVTQQCLYTGIRMVKPGLNLRDVGRTIFNMAKKHRFSVVRDFCGHGIGSEFHENGFDVLHFDHPHAEDQILLPGLTFTIEPMINAGKSAVKVLKDGWTAVTRDKQLSAQWEHTLLVTEEGVEVLTLRAEEQGKI